MKRRGNSGLAGNLHFVMTIKRGGLKNTSFLIGLKMEFFEIRSRRLKYWWNRVDRSQ